MIREGCQRSPPSKVNHTVPDAGLAPEEVGAEEIDDVPEVRVPGGIGATSVRVGVTVG